MSTATLGRPAVSSTIAARAEDVLCSARLYMPVRNAYQRVLNRSHYADRARTRAFFGRLLSPGDLVFDVGANHGRMSEAFLEVGARVVAIEPNPTLAATVRRRYGHRLVAVEEAAIGAEPATMELHLGRHDGHSTLSTEWMDAAPTGDRFGGSVDVEVTTMDALIARHGRPDFVKIDVEGFEDQVLAGLSGRVGCLSLEYQCAAPDVAYRCLDRLEALGFARFATTEVQERPELRWVDGAVVRDGLAAHAAREPSAYGDLYAA
jgi:FkbM family methyltransferase